MFSSFKWEKYSKRNPRISQRGYVYTNRTNNHLPCKKKKKKLGNFQILRFIPFDRGILQTFLVFQKLRSEFAGLGFLQAGVPR